MNFLNFKLYLYVCVCVLDVFLAKRYIAFIRYQRVL